MDENHLIFPEKILLKYDEPYAVSQSELRRPDEDKCNFRKYADLTNLRQSILRDKVKENLRIIESKISLKETRELLDNVIPPRTFECNDILYKQHVSIIPANRAEVLLMNDILTSIENQRQFKCKIFCPLRREVYDDLFFELIRQLTIQCIERGILLKRVKDELHMTMVGYKTIFQNFQNFSLHKAHSVETSKNERLNKLKLLEEEVKELYSKVDEAKKWCKTIERKEEGLINAIIKKNREEIRIYTLLHNQLALQTEDLLAVLKPE